MLKLPEEKSRTASNLRVWRDGFLLQGANPKALLFFAAILPQFIAPNYSVPLQVLVLGVSSIIVEFLILVSYGRLAARAMLLAKDSRFEKISNRVAGGLLIGAGLGVARLRH